MTNAVARILITGILVTHLLNPFFLYHLLKGIILSFRKWLRRILLKETSFVEYKEYFFCGIAPVSRFLLVQSLFFAFGCGFALFYGMYATSLVQERPFLPVIFYLVNVIMSEALFPVRIYLGINGYLYFTAYALFIPCPLLVKESSLLKKAEFLLFRILPFAMCYSHY